MEQKNYFPKNLLTLRKSKGMKQYQIQEKLGIQRSTWSNWENGKSEPGIEMICKIGNFFNIHIGRLISEEITDNREQQDSHMAMDAPPDGYTPQKKELDLKDTIIESQKQTIKALEGQIHALIESITLLKSKT